MITENLTEIERRRTFAIISHPDAGKTTLTENTAANVKLFTEFFAKLCGNENSAFFIYIVLIATKKHEFSPLFSPL